MGFAWGTVFGAAVVQGFFLHWSFFIIAVIPLIGNYMFGRVHKNP